MNNDLISREAAVKLARSLVEYDEGGWDMSVRAVAVEDIEALPSVDAAPVVHGRWEYFVHVYSTCSHCKERVAIFSGHMSYCPNCGAKMDQEQIAR